MNITYLIFAALWHVCGSVNLEWCSLARLYTPFPINRQVHQDCGIFPRPISLALMCLYMTPKQVKSHAFFFLALRTLFQLPFMLNMFLLPFVK